jgi:hypothetical protein
MPEVQESIHPTGPGHLGVAERGIMALVSPERLRRILSKMLDENEFLGPYGIRSISKFHERHPYVMRVSGQEYGVDYLPAKSNTGMFGGNSNWRGPVWLPVNAVLIRALLQFYLYYGDTFRIECPTGSGTTMNLFEVSKEVADRLARISSSSTSTSTATTGRGWGPVTRPAGPASWPRPSSSTASWTPRDSWRVARGPRSSRGLAAAPPGGERRVT